MKIILASASPRRKEILEKNNYFPIIMPSDVDETIPEDIAVLGVEEIVKYLAHIKASAVYNSLAEIGCESNSILELLDKEVMAGERILILGADTIVYKDSIIGKPKDEEDAFAILSSLKNTSHHVYTGVSLIDYRSGEETVFYDDTKVFFYDYTDDEIIRFIREEPPYDKSGSYAIQSSWSRNVEHIEGDIDNVIGLPWKKLKDYLG